MQREGRYPTPGLLGGFQGDRAFLRPAAGVQYTVTHCRAQLIFRGFCSENFQRRRELALHELHGLQLARAFTRASFHR